MRSSKGKMRRSTRKLSKHHRERGMPSPTAFLREFRDGETVHLAINGSVHAGMPDPKFQGRTGRVVRKQGASYLVAVRDGPHTTKTLVVNPVHLKRA